MKSQILSLLMMAGGVAAAYGYGVEVTSTDQFSNNKVYLLERNATSAKNGKGFAYVTDNSSKATLATASAASADTSSVASHFTFHYSPREKALYLYNLSAGMFISGNTKHQACVSTKAVDCVPLYSDLAKSWLIDCGGYALACDDTDGFILFYDDLTSGRARTNATHFKIYEKFNASVSDEISNEIEAKIADARESSLKVYRDFLTKAGKVLSTNDMPRYLGEYDVEELANALDHADDYSIAEIEEIYQRTLLSRYPKAGKYYRLHNGDRPGSGLSGRPTNYLSTDVDGTLRVRTIEEPAANIASEGLSDDLVLFRFWPVDGDPTQVKIEATAFGEYLAGGGNQEYVTLGSYDGATVYELRDVNTQTRSFRFALPAKSSFLSVTSVPNCQLWGYSTTEAANQWYIEPIETITVPVDENGYATACVPCAVEVEDGAKAYTVTSFASGKAYVEEVESPIHKRTPLILKAAPGKKEVTLTISNTTKWVASEMTGATRVLESTPGRYVPQFSASGIKFVYEAASDNTVAPGAAYIVSDDQGPIETVMGSNPDASIEEISASDANVRELFDLVGRKVDSTPRPGVYVDAKTRKAIRVK